MLTGLILLGLIMTGYIMVSYHPHQHVYFNFLAGKNMKVIKNRFELDYWGLSYKQALEYILKNDPGNKIKICVANSPGVFNSYILGIHERNRIEYVNNPAEARYFLSNYRWHKEEYPYNDEFYSIKIDGAKIMVVYKLK